MVRKGGGKKREEEEEERSKEWYKCEYILHIRF